MNDTGSPPRSTSENSGFSRYGSSAPAQIAADVLIILFLSAIAVCVNLIWLENYTTPPYADYAHHFEEASYFAFRMGMCPLWEWFLNLFCHPGSYPPGPYAVTYLSSFLIGSGVKAALCSQLFFTFVMIGSVYYAIRPFHGTCAAAAAASVCAASPNLLLPSYNYIVDYPSAAMAALGVCLFFNSRCLDSAFFSTALGICLGLGGLCKPTTIFAVLPAIIILILLRLPAAFKASPAKTLQTAAIVLSIAVLSHIELRATFELPNTECDFITFYPVYKILILITVLALGTASALLGQRIWKSVIKDKETSGIGRFMRNATLCFAGLYTTFFPWAALNSATIVHRTEPLNSDMLARQFTMANAQHFFIDAVNHGAGPLILTFITLGAIYSFRKQGTFEERLLLISCILSVLLSWLTLGQATRYILPVYAISCCFYPAFFRRVPYGNALALLIIGGMFWSNVMIPLSAPQTSAASYTDAVINHDNSINSTLPYSEPGNTTPFFYGWHLARCLDRTFPGQETPALAAVLIDPDFINNSPAESLRIGFGTWENLHSWKVISIMVEKRNLEARHYLIGEFERMLINAGTLAPDKIPALKQILIFGKTSGSFDYVIEARQAGAPHTQADLVCRLLKNPENRPVHFRTFAESRDCAVTVYSARPELLDFR